MSALVEVLYAKIANLAIKRNPQEEMNGSKVSKYFGRPTELNFTQNFKGYLLSRVRSNYLSFFLKGYMSAKFMGHIFPTAVAFSTSPVHGHILSQVRR